MRGVRSKGFAVVEVIIAVVIILALAGIAYWVYTQQSEDDDSTETATSQSDADTDEAIAPEAPEIENTEDLAEAEQLLDSIDLDAAQRDEAALDAEANEF